jgi:GNAT superfamily N-acetyltransferase
MRVRHATRWDIPRIVQLATVAFAEARYGRYAFNAEKAERMILDSIDNDDIAVLVVEHDSIGAPFGFLAGIVTEHYFADTIYATNIALYVSPNRRGSRAAYRLVREFERVARAKGASEIMLGVTSGVGARRTERFYNALGYSTVGALTVKYIGE